MKKASPQTGRVEVTSLRGAIEAIDILQNLKLEDSWLIEYRDEVVEQLKSKEISA